MFGTGPFEDINLACPPVPNAKPTPVLDRVMIALAILMSIGVLVIAFWNG